MSNYGQRRIGAFKPQKAARMSRDAAETIAATALSSVAAEHGRLARFLAETGMSPDDLRRAAGSREVLAGVLAHVLEDESLLLVIASEIGETPERLAAAHAILQAPDGGEL